MSDCCDQPAKNSGSQKTDRRGKAESRAIPITIGLFTLLLLVVGTWAISRPNGGGLPKNTDARAFAEEKAFDWGEININGGDVTREFKITNQGTGVLGFTNVWASCACTTAEITIDGKTSPTFGMHTKSTWVGRIDPGETATLKVIFDPLFHGPDAVGPIERFITAETNDPSNPVLEFKLTGNVVKK